MYIEGDARTQGRAEEIERTGTGAFAAGANWLIDDQTMLADVDREAKSFCVTDDDRRVGARHARLSVIV
jgi:hypothetical protein